MIIAKTKKYWEQKGKIDLRENEGKTPVESGYPITSVTIDLTKRCNFACTYCNPAGTPILMEDLSYKKIEDVKVGDKVIGFTKPEERNGKHTKYTVSTVEGTSSRISSLVEVKTTNGSFKCTPDHKWFNGRSYMPARVGMNIHYLSDPVFFEENDEYKLGYIHGIMAGDGSFSEGEHIYKSGPQKGYKNTYHHFRLALNDIEAIDRTESYIGDLKLGRINRFQYTEKMIGLRSGSRELFNKVQGYPSNESTIDYLKGWAAGIFDAEGSYDGDSLRIAQLEGLVLDSIIYVFSRLGFDIKIEDYRDVKTVRINGGQSNIVKFFAMCNPAISRKKDKVVNGSSIYGKSEILSIRQDKEEVKVYSLQTSTGNYIAHGHTSKNCFTNLSKGKYHVDDLTEEMGYKIIDWLLDEGTRGKAERVDITFWGGEPLLKWELLKKLVIYAEVEGKKAGVKVGFNGTTNVSLLTPEKFDFLDDHKIYFLLSIDGRKESHDKHRVFPDGTGTWDIVDKNVDAILERWPFYNTRLSFSPDNLDGFLEDLKYLYNKGFRSIAYSPVAEGDWTQERLDKLDQVWQDISDWAIDLHKKGDPVEIKYLRDGCKNEFYDVGNRAPCGAGRGYIGITTDGSIYPCHRFNKFNDPRPWYEREVCLGHIDYGILNHEFRDNFVNWDTSKHMSSACQECEELNKSCNGGCWATNWDITGDLGGLVPIECQVVFSNRKNGKKMLEAIPELGDKYRKKPKKSQKPMVQGCQCYNVEDVLYGRKTVNKNDDQSCLCNMAVYGDKPREVQRCNCYNVEDQVVSHYDKTSAKCGRFSGKTEKRIYDKNPVELAIDYLKSLDKDVGEMTEKEKLDIDEFASLIESVEDLGLK